MRIVLFALAALTATSLVDVRPSEARPWYPWCAQFADRSGITSCTFPTFEACRVTVSGIGGSCIQNWYPPPAPPPTKPRRRQYY
jgi:Protein of unknown function (DUF3551)